LKIREEGRGVGKKGYQGRGGKGSAKGISSVMHSSRTAKASKRGKLEQEKGEGERRDARGVQRKKSPGKKTRLRAVGRF